MPAEPYPCPLSECEGIVLVKRFGGMQIWGCDGKSQHTDSQVRNGMGLESDVWDSEDKARLDATERRLDPVAWLLDRVHEARSAREAKIVDEDLSNFTTLPAYSTGLCGDHCNGLISLRGMTTLSGKASSGKTWFALRAALESAGDGWDVHYIAAEAEDVIKRRVFMAYGSNPPKRFRLHSIEPGLRVEDIIERLSKWIISTRTLLVIDSLSTLMSFMKADRNESRWDAQGRVETFLMGLRKLTRGDVSIINISEANAAGESKGRTIDHRSDIAINFKSIEDSDAKEIRIVKAWESNTGLVGRGMVDPSAPGLRLIYEGSRSSAPGADEGDGF